MPGRRSNCRLDSLDPPSSPAVRADPGVVGQDVGTVLARLVVGAAPDTEPDILHILPTYCLVDVAAQDVVEVVRLLGMKQGLHELVSELHPTHDTSSFRYVARMS